MKTRTACLALVVTSGLSFAACSQTSPNSSGTGGGAGTGGGTGGSGSPKGGTGGSVSGNGGSGATGGAGGGSSGSGSGTCPNVTACGGPVVGTWNVTASCLNLSGQLDLPTAGLDPRSCTSAPITGHLSVTGSITYNADETYTDHTVTTGSAHVDLAAGCLLISGTKIDCQGAGAALESAGFRPATCTVAPTGGGCSCDGMVNQMGGIGLPTANPGTSGDYKASNNVLTLTTDSGFPTQAYCASGTTLTVTPQSTNSTVIAGTITLQPPGVGGAGGAGNGGSSGAGAAGGAGGMGTGGVSAAGGASGGTAGGGAGLGQGGATAGSNPGGAAGTGGTGMGTDGPCDIYGTTTPCVAAYSTIRRLSKSYTGPLVQVRSGSSAKNTGSGGMTKDFFALADGYIDTAAIDAYCPTGTICTVSLLYDQSGNKNDLPVAKKGNTAGGATGGEDDYESSATKGAVTAGGHKVYPLYMNAHEGYRIAKAGTKMPRGTESQGIYEIADGTHWGSPCCWDFGNVTTDPTKYGVMNTLFFGKAFWGNGAGTSGPWMMADFEGGVWAGGSQIGDPGWGGLDDKHPQNPNNPALAVPFAMGILKTQGVYQQSSSKWALRSADVKAASDLTTSFEGPLPKAMDNLGAVVLGVGGDNSNNSYGTFYEGAIVAGYPTPDVDLQVLKNVQAVGYSK